MRRAIQLKMSFGHIFHDTDSPTRRIPQVNNISKKSGDFYEFNINRARNIDRLAGRMQTARR